MGRGRQGKGGDPITGTLAALSAFGTGIVALGAATSAIVGMTMVVVSCENDRHHHESDAIAPPSPKLLSQGCDSRRRNVPPSPVSLGEGETL